jgi:hypothetical protein
MPCQNSNQDPRKTKSSTSLKVQHHSLLYRHHTNDRTRTRPYGAAKTCHLGISAYNPHDCCVVFNCKLATLHVQERVYGCLNSSDVNTSEISNGAQPETRQTKRNLAISNSRKNFDKSITLMFPTGYTKIAGEETMETSPELSGALEIMLCCNF